MNKFNSLIVGMLCLYSSASNAQYTQNFDSETAMSLYTSCWTFSNASFLPTNNATNKYIGLQLANNGSTTSLGTPYIKPVSQNLNFKFSYRLSGNLGNGTRTLKVMMGTTELRSLAVTTSTETIASINITLPDLINYPQFSFVLTGSGGNTQVFIDNIIITGLTSETHCGQISPVILPVQLISFNGIISSGKAKLNWTVDENETGNFFEVQSSTDGRNYVHAAIIFNSNNPGQEAYQHTAATEVKTTTYYRLKVVNKDNSVTYSKVVVLKNFVAGSETRLVLNQNPVQHSIGFSFTANEKQSMQISIYTLSGIKIYSRTIMAEKGTNAINFGLDNHISNGSYILALQGQTTYQTITFIKQ